MRTTQVEQDYLLQLVIQLIAQGGQCGIYIKCLHLPGKVWLNFEDIGFGTRGTAQIGGEVADGSHGSPEEAAEKFIDYLVKRCEAESGF